MMEITIKRQNGTEYTVTFDDDDEPIVRSRSWYIGYSGRSPNTLYARTTLSGHKHISMHRLILGDRCRGYDVDHIDGNGLNNSRNNLRIATRSQNCANRLNAPSAKTSPYKGVSWKKRNKKWVAQIKVNQRVIHLGLFECAMDAACAYAKAAKQYFGEFAASYREPR
jgi:hypothetical protein